MIFIIGIGFIQGVVAVDIFGVRQGGGCSKVTSALFGCGRVPLGVVVILIS